MKTLFSSALNNRKQLFLFLSSLFVILLLTIVNFLEISSLGVLVDVGSLKDSMENGSESINSMDWISKKTNPMQYIIIAVYRTINLQIGSIYVIFFVLMVLAVIKAISIFLNQYLSRLLAISVSQNLRQRYFDHIQLLSMSFYHKYNIGNLSSRLIGDIDQIAFSTNAILGSCVQIPFIMLISLLFCFYISWQLSLIVFLGLPLIAIPIIFLTRKVRKASKQLQINQEKFSSLLIDILSGIETVKIFAMEWFSIKKYRSYNDQVALSEKKSAKYGSLIRPILHLVMTLYLAGVILLGLLGLKLVIAQLIVFCGSVQRFYEAVKKIGDENIYIQRGISAAERMVEVLNLKPEIEDPLDAIQFVELKESIEFDHVWFRYQEDWVLKDLSFTLRKGEVFAIVGPTGSGKSTIIQLLLRLYRVERGEIRIDGIPIDNYTQRSLREQISFVSQKPFLFSDTIAANIAFGSDFSKEEIQEAAIRAHADDFIIKQPGGYGHVLTQAGADLSGGQQQKLAIARALVKKAKVLVLDEATSSLDVISESEIRAETMELRGRLTQIIIAHRLGTIVHADHIIFINAGCKIAEGSYQELLNTCDLFKEMRDLFQNSLSQNVIADTL